MRPRWCAASVTRRPVEVSVDPASATNPPVAGDVVGGLGGSPPGDRVGQDSGMGPLSDAEGARGDIASQRRPADQAVASTAVRTTGTPRYGGIVPGSAM